MKKILVTGGAGFIGSHLFDSLLSQNQSIIGLDSYNDYYDPKNKEQNNTKTKKTKKKIFFIWEKKTNGKNIQMKKIE